MLPETDDSYVDLLMSLVINGYSESQLTKSLRELGLPYSTSEMGKIRDQLNERLSDLKRKELSENIFVMFIDGYHTEIKDNLKVRKACVYTVLGIDLEGRKDVYGFYTFFGSENRADWLKVFNDLIERGLKKVVVVVSDRYSEDIRKHMYTTNSVESINSRIEQIKIKLGGYFQSTNILEVNLMLQVDRLKQGKWKNPVPMLKAKSYDVLQLFNIKFNDQTQLS